MPGHEVRGDGHYLFLSAGGRRDQFPRGDLLLQDVHLLQIIDRYSRKKGAPLCKGAPFLWSNGKSGCGIYGVNF